MKRTVPQVLMLNHEAWREYKNADIKAKAKREYEQKRDEEDPIIPELGIRASELNDSPEKWETYLTDWSLG